MKKKIYLLLLLFPLQTYASLYFDLSGGVLRRELSGDTESYKGQNSLASEFSIGYNWGNWDLALDATYAIGRQKDYSVTYRSNTTIIDDFNWQSFNVGPTLKYHVIGATGNWSYAPYIGLFYNRTDLGNSAKFRDPTTGKKEDLGQETWGYGGKLGVQFKTFTPDNSWLDAVHYKVFTSYTRYRGTEAEYVTGTTLNRYDGDTPDKLSDISVGFMVGVSFGDKVFKKAKQAVARIADF